MTTPNDVFNTAIHLIDEQNDTTGETVTMDTKEYRLRTLSILSVLRNELYPFSDTYESMNGRKSVLPPLTDFAQDTGLDDFLASTVLPYGLAGHLLLGENDSLANFFIQRYGELTTQARMQAPCVWEEMELPAWFV